jgi:hypothetical protein
VDRTVLRRLAALTPLCLIETLSRRNG